MIMAIRQTRPWPVLYSAAAVQGMLLWNEEISQQDDDRDFVKETAATAQDNVVVVADRLSDLMGHFRDVEPVMANNNMYNNNNNNSITLNRSHSVLNIERLPTFKDWMPPSPSTLLLRPDTGVILVIDNIQQLHELQAILVTDMSAIKFVLVRMPQGEQEDGDAEDAPQKEQQQHKKEIEAFMQELWRRHSVHRVFFVTFSVSGGGAASSITGNDNHTKQKLCSTTGEALFYNPFIRNSGGGGAAAAASESSSTTSRQQQWGQLDKIPINCGLSKSLISDNNGERRATFRERRHQELEAAQEQQQTVAAATTTIDGGDVDGQSCCCGSLASVGRINYYRDLVEYIDLIKRVGVGMNYNGYPLRGVLFPTTMTFLKTESTILNRTVTEQQRNHPFEMFFGLDVDVAEELAKRLNFTLQASGDSDGMDYGFQV